MKARISDFRPRPVADLKPLLHSDWKRTRASEGTTFTLELAGVALRVQQRTWRKPGFKDITSRGWQVYINGEPIGSTLARAIDAQLAAQREANHPGHTNHVARMAQLQPWLDRNGLNGFGDRGTQDAIDRDHAEALA